MNPVYKTFSMMKTFYVYDRSTNIVIRINQEEYESLEAGDENTVEEFRKKGFFEDNVIQKIKHPGTDNYAYYLKNNLSQIAIQLTQDCNLRCSYCPYMGTYDNRQRSNKKISFDTIRKGIDYLFMHSQNTKKIHIGFYGGEPLLEMPLIKETLGYIDTIKEGRQVNFNITTNGTLLTDDIVEFFLDKNISILISLDGAKEYHDVNRKFPNGSGSFDTIMLKLTHIKEKYPEFFHRLRINSVISTNNDLSCTNDFFNADHVLEQLSFTMSTVSEFNLKSELNYNENFNILNAYETCKSYLHMLGKISTRHVSKLYQQNEGMMLNTYKTLLPYKMRGGEQHPGGPCLPGVNRLFMDVDGYFYPCEKVSESSEIMKIGHVDQGIDVEKAKYLLNVGMVTEQECKGCFAFNFCKACCDCCDGNTELSREKKLVYCKKVKFNAIENMKQIIMLKEFGYPFEEKAYRSAEYV